MDKKRKRIILALMLVAVLMAGAWMALGTNLSALEDPGRLETWAAARAKRILIRGAARAAPAAPPRDAAAISMGGMQFRADCGACHGSDGRTPTDIGKWMSPRAPDLGTAQVQAWSDAELFWIIRNGIKMTGMPGFGEIHDDDRIWQLAFYVRQIGEEAATAAPREP